MRQGNGTANGRESGRPDTNLETLSLDHEQGTGPY